MTSGIYVIRVARESAGDYREYVGQAQNIAKRWREHKRLLRHGTHQNAKLQYAFQKYGVSAFTFEIIEEVNDRALLNEREHYHADQRKPYYNIGPLGGVRRGVRGLLFSETIERQVETEYFRLLAEGTTPNAVEIARRLGVSRRTVDYVFRYAPWWSGALGRAASLDGLRKGQQTLAALGHPELKKALEIQRLAGFPGLQKARQVAASMGYPGTRASNAKMARLGYPNLAKSWAAQAAAGQPRIRVAQATLKATDYAPIRAARARERAETRGRIWTFLVTYWQANTAPLSHRKIQALLGVSHATVSVYTREMQTEGIIDAAYRPIILNVPPRQLSLFAD